MEASEARLGAAHGGGVSTVAVGIMGMVLYNDYEEVSTVIRDDALECGVVAGFIVYCDLFFLGAACARVS